MNVVTLLLANPKHLEIQRPDCAHFVDFLDDDEFFFSQKSLLLFWNARQLSLVEGVLKPFPR